jgi:hypothetical protein
VIDTIGITDKTFVDNYRTPHTTQMHVVERWKIVEGGNAVEVSMTIDDPAPSPRPGRPRSVGARFTWRR